MSSLQSPKRILIVDDNRDAADLTADLLAMYGHFAVAAYGGIECIQRAVELLPDVILLDLGMPGLDGFATAHALRQLPELRDTVLIALTAWDDAATRQRTASAGFILHLVKPIAVESINFILAGVGMSGDSPKTNGISERAGASSTLTLVE